jgi:tyrosyl-tRNA synthetase
MQGFDSVAVESDIELGGTDQTFSLLLARTSAPTAGEQSVLTMPILPGIDGGTKMSKSLGSQVGVTDPADEIFGRTMSLPARRWARGSTSGSRGTRRRPARREAGAGRGDRRSRHGDGKGARRRASTGCSSITGCRGHRGGGAVGQRAAASAAVLAELRRLALRCAADLGQGGVRVDGEPLPAEPLDVRRPC